jgi:hypothetical protein
MAMGGVSLGSQGCAAEDGTAACYQRFVRAGAFLCNLKVPLREHAENAGVNISVSAGNTVSLQGESGNCMYVVRSGVIEW